MNEVLKDESWIIAMHEELNQFIANDVWELVPQPKNMTIIGTKWVYRNKLDENGFVSRNKARLVTQGYNQQEGIDYDENYAPVVWLRSIRILLCALDFKLFQMDVKSALLNGFINEEFEMSMMGELNFFLVLQIKQIEDGIFFNQSKYVRIKRLLDNLEVTAAKVYVTAAKQKLVTPLEMAKGSFCDEKISHVISNDFMAFVLDKDRVGLLRFVSAIIRPSRGLVVAVLMWQSDIAGWGIFLQRTDYTMGVQCSTWQTGFNSITTLVDMIFRWSNDGDGVLERLAPEVANLAADEKCSMKVVTFNRHLRFVNACLKLPLSLDIWCCCIISEEKDADQLW
ncbi:copia protein [Tanacetum coccineum]